MPEGKVRARSHPLLPAVLERILREQFHGRDAVQCMPGRNLLAAQLRGVHQLHQGHVQRAGCAVVHGMPERLLRELRRRDSVHGLPRRQLPAGDRVDVMRILLAWPIPTRHGAGVMRVLQPRSSKRRHWFIDLHAMRGGKVLVDQLHEVHRLRGRQAQRIRSVRVHGVRRRVLFRFARRRGVHGVLGGESSTEERVLLLRTVRSGSLPVFDGADELQGVHRGDDERY